MATSPFSRSVFLFVLLALLSAPAAALEWNIKDLGVLPGATYSTGMAVNDLGQVAGDLPDLGLQFGEAGQFAGGYSYISGPNGGPLQLIDPHTAQATLRNMRAIELNNQGQVVGYGEFGSSIWAAWRTAANGGPIEHERSFTRGIDINDSGAAVYHEQGSEFYLVHPDGTFVQPFPAEGTGINNAGQLSLNTSFIGINTGAIWSIDQGLRLVRVNGEDTQLFDINNEGQVLGRVKGIDNQIFVIDPDGTTHFIGLPGEITGDLAYPVAFYPRFNDNGQIIGQLEATTGESFSFLASLSSSEIIRLASESDILNAGWTELLASDINNLGQITGTGIINGNTRAFLLTPIPEPETWAMMLAGLSVLGFMRRRKVAQI